MGRQGVMVDLPSGRFYLHIDVAMSDEGAHAEHQAQCGLSIDCRLTIEFLRTILNFYVSSIAIRGKRPQRDHHCTQLVVGGSSE